MVESYVEVVVVSIGGFTFFIYIIFGYLIFLRPKSLNLLQFTCPNQVGVDVAICLVQRAYSYFDNTGSTVRVIVFNTINPSLLEELLGVMQVDTSS